MNKKFTQQLMTLILGGVVCLSATIPASAQGVYQLPNSGFDQWETGIKLDGSATTKTPIEEPVGWNSFSTADGNAALVNMAKSKIVKQKEGENTYVAICSYVVPILNIVANGNMTTGIINVGNTSASHQSNHNYTPSDTTTKVGVNNFRQQFNGRPDAFSVKMKYIANGRSNIASDDQIYYAQATATIHTNDRFQEPYETEENIKNRRVAFASINPKADNNNIEWKEYIQEFEYNTDESLEPALILLNFGTNKAPGKGSGKDTLCVDDVRFIYYSSLKDIKIDNQSIQGFDESTLEYQMEGDAPNIDDVNYITKSRWATSEISQFEEGDNVVITIDVKGYDFEASGNKTTYRLVYDKPKTETSVDDIVGIYKGELSITLMGSTVTAPDQITLTKDGDDVVGLHLYDFAFGEDLILGNIDLDNIPVTYDDATSTYSFISKTYRLLLADGEINADVTASGTIKDSVADLVINVLWVDAELPIEVTFKGDMNTTSINDETIDNIKINTVSNEIQISGYTGELDIYTIEGKLAYSDYIYENKSITLNAGIYIIKADQYITKAIIK